MKQQVKGNCVVFRTCPCKLCGNPTRMLGTKLCDPCWELDRRIRMNPVIAGRILISLNNKYIEEVKNENKSADTRSVQP